MSQSEDGDANRTFMATDSQELEVKNEEFGVDNANFDTNDFVVAATNKELVNLENACVNIDNSSDVIFGSVKHYHVNGNLTIFQNRDASIEGDDEHQAKLPNGIQNVTNEVVKQQKESIDNFFQQRNTLGWIIVYLLICSCTIFLYLGLIRYMYFEKSPTIERPYGYNLGEFRIFYPSEWGGLRPLDRKIMPLPLGLVIIGETDTETCLTPDYCFTIVKTNQIYEMNNLGYSDICDHFLIGGEGNIYVGRGWDTRNCLPKLSVYIRFIGNFSSYYLTESMQKSLKLLLQQGLELNKLAPEYILVGINQTEKSFLPGKHAYEFIKSLPHFSNIDLRDEDNEDNEKCYVNQFNTNKWLQFASSL